MLQLDPAERATAKEALRHPFFAEIATSPAPHLSPSARRRLRRRRSRLSASIDHPVHATVDGDGMHDDAEGFARFGVGAMIRIPGRSNIRVVRLLGEGGFSTVWEAKSNGRSCALKVQKSDGRYYDVALDEARMLMMSASHPGVLEMVDAPFIIEGHYCLMLPVCGANLLSLNASFGYQGLPIPVVRRLGKEMLQAVAHIHGRGVIHTDLKLENILLPSGLGWLSRFMPKD